MRPVNDTPTALRTTTPAKLRTVAGLHWKVTRCFNLVIQWPDRRFVAVSPWGSDRKTWRAYVCERQHDGTWAEPQYAERSFRNVKTACNWLIKQMESA